MYSGYVAICFDGQFGDPVGEVGEVLVGAGEMQEPFRPLYIVI